MPLCPAGVSSPPTSTNVPPNWPFRFIDPNHPLLLSLPNYGLALRRTDRSQFSYSAPGIPTRQFTLGLVFFGYHGHAHRQDSSHGWTARSGSRAHLFSSPTLQLNPRFRAALRAVLCPGPYRRPRNGPSVRVASSACASPRRLAYRTDQADLYYTLLLKDAGCSSNSSRLHHILNADDLRAKGDLKTVDWTRVGWESLHYAVTHVATSTPFPQRVWKLVRVAATQQRDSCELVKFRCERGSQIARKLGFSEGSPPVSTVSTSTGTAPAIRTACAQARFRSSPVSPILRKPSQSSCSLAATRRP